MGSNPTSQIMTDSEAFYKHFRHQVADIEASIEDIKAQDPTTKVAGTSDIEQCQSAIITLSSEVSQALAHLPSHDQRTYGEEIKRLRQKLSTAKDLSAPKKKFSFKSGSSLGVKKGPSAAAVDGGATASQAGPDTLALGPVRERAETDASSSQTERQRKEVDIESDSHRHIIVQSSASGSANPGSIKDIHHSVIDRRRTSSGLTPLASLLLKDIESSLVICGRVSGPIHLTNIRDSTIVVSTQQFRMHESHNCDIYLHAASRPIVEHCSGIRFAPLPELYRVDDGEGKGEAWMSVDDFDWHRGDPSPNWRVLEAGDRVTDEVWRAVVPGGDGRGVDDILAAMGIVRITST